MKKLVTILMMAMPLAAMAQNVWEKPKEESSEKTAKVVTVKENKDEKYLE